MTRVVDIKTIQAKFAEDPEKMVLIAIGGVSLLAMFFLGTLLSSGIFLGICTALSMLLLLFKSRNLKPRVWNTVCDHPLATDVVLSFGILAFAATGVTGIIAGVTGALFTSAALKYAVEVMGKAKDENGVEYESYKIPFLSENEPEQEEVNVGHTEQQAA